MIDIGLLNLGRAKFTCGCQILSECMLHPVQIPEVQEKRFGF
jgi:hypothetical protein